MLSIFHVEEPKAAAGPAPAAAARQPEGRLLGTGVDQALHGGKVTAGADERTNSVVVAAPADTLKAIEDMLKEIDQNPATAAAPGDQVVPPEGRRRRHGRPGAAGGVPAATGPSGAGPASSRTSRRPTSRCAAE